MFEKSATDFFFFFFVSKFNSNLSSITHKKHSPILRASCDSGTVLRVCIDYLT